jgi:Ankyrin repeats (3 copies)
MGNDCKPESNNIAVGIPISQMELQPKKLEPVCESKKSRKEPNHLNINTDGNTPLTKLIIESDDKDNFNELTLKTLVSYLRQGANPNIPCNSSDGKTIFSPLYICCRNCHSEIGLQMCKALLDAGADVEPEYTILSNYNPLQIVISKNKTKTAVKFVKLLLERGANPNAIRGNETALATANKYDGPNKDEIVDLILTAQKEC